MTDEVVRLTPQAQTVEKPSPMSQVPVAVPKTLDSPRVQLIDKVVSISVMAQRQVPSAPRVQKILLEMPVVQFSDRYVDMPVVTKRQVPMVPNVQKTEEVPQIQYVDKIVEAPVVASHQPVPVDAETFSRVEDVSVGTQTVSKKRKLSMELLTDVRRRARSRTREGVQAMEAGGSHLQATSEEERIVDWTQDLRENRRMVEFLVRRERKLDVKADVAVRRLAWLEKEHSQLEDEEREASLPDALADRTKIVKLVVDKWFVDKGFGFGRVPTGEVIIIRASVVRGAEVLMIGTDAWVQMMRDDARAQGGVEHAKPGVMSRGKRRETKRGQACTTSQPKQAVSRRRSRTARFVWLRTVLLPRATALSQQAQASSTTQEGSVELNHE